MRSVCPQAGDDAKALRQLDGWKSIYAGKSVALVGNAQSIFDRQWGAEIEACDVVARFNFGFVQSEAHQGRRTDVLLLGAKLAYASAQRRFGCSRIIWTSADRGRLRLDYLLHQQRLAFVPFQDLARLTGIVGARPSSGLIAVDLFLNRLETREVRLYGFDWKQTKTFYEDRIQRNVHDWEAEADLIRRWSGEMSNGIVIRSQGAETPS